jgi:hypothetical protein
MRLIAPIVFTVTIASVAAAQTPSAATVPTGTVTAAPQQPAASNAPPTTSTAVPVQQPAPASQASGATGTSGAAPTECRTCPDAVSAYWVAFWVISAFLVLGLFDVLVSLKNSGDWSLAGAMAEKTATKVETLKTVQRVQSASNPNGAQVQETKTIEEPALVGSASRLIALVGTLVLTAMMLGIGYGMIWSQPPRRALHT